MISWCNWSIADKEETAAVLVPGASATGGWSESDLTESGAYVRSKIINWYENPPTDIDDKQNSVDISNFELHQNYPNPFNPKTTIAYTIKSIHESSLHTVDLSVYNILGQKVKTLVSEKKRLGSYQVDFDGSDFSSGIYLYRLEVGNYQDMKKMILVR